MAQLPAILVTNDPQSSWASKVNKHSESNRIIPSRDFVLTRNGGGTMFELKNRNKTTHNAMRYARDYSSGKSYDIGDVTRVADTEYFVSTDGGMSHTLTRLTAGVWVCVRPVPNEMFTKMVLELNISTQAIQSLLRQVGVNYAPQWPEPANPDDRFWELLVPWNICTT